MSPHPQLLRHGDFCEQLTHRDSRRVLRAVRAGKPAGADLEATFTDTAGNELRPSFGVRLR